MTFKIVSRNTMRQVPATPNRRPLKLIFSESFETEKEAKQRELYWKSGAG